MRITSLDLSVAGDLGLRPRKMEQLGQLVVLAGPNGAGKSRVLSFVERTLRNPDLRHGREQIEQQLLRISQRAENLQEGLNVRRREFERLLGVIASVTFRPKFEPDRVTSFVPESTQLTDHRNLNEADQEAAERRLREGTGVVGSEQFALAHIARVERRRFNVTHQDFRAAADEKQIAIDEQERLGDLLEALLGARPELDQDQQPRLFGFPIGAANLSAGQKLLLQLAALLHAQGSRLDGLVLLLDELECHLHPAVLLEVIKRLRSINELGQLWIATHSVPLLADLPPESIWYVDQGGVSWAGRKPEIVLQGLLGGPKGAEQLGEFLCLPAQLAANRFAAECLSLPKVADTGADDPQAAQVRAFLATAFNESAPLKVLDYGAGVGRLLRALYERWDGERAFAEAIDYRAFEPNPKDELPKALNATYGEDSDPLRLAKSHDELRTFDPGSFDVIVLCNVLHEILPEQWIRLFGSDGTLRRLLKSEGKLLILPRSQESCRFG